MKPGNNILTGLITCCVIFLLAGCSSRQADKPDFSIGKGVFLLDGKPFVIKAAEIHYTRSPASRRGVSGYDQGYKAYVKTTPFAL